MAGRTPKAYFPPEIIQSFEGGIANWRVAKW